MLDEYFKAVENLKKRTLVARSKRKLPIRIGVFYWDCESQRALHLCMWPTLEALILERVQVVRRLQHLRNVVVLTSSEHFALELKFKRLDAS